MDVVVVEKFDCTIAKFIRVVVLKFSKCIISRDRKTPNILNMMAKVSCPKVPRAEGDSGPQGHVLQVERAQRKRRRVPDIAVSNNGTGNGGFEIFL